MMSWTQIQSTERTTPQVQLNPAPPLIKVRAKCCVIVSHVFQRQSFFFSDVIVHTLNRS